MANADRLCMGCMNPLPEGRTECGICGYPVNGENPPEYLPVGTNLSERYMVGRVLSVCGDAALYIGYDGVLKAPIYIREFLPSTLCERGRGGAVKVIGGCETIFQEYLTEFRNHARALARLRDLPAMIPLYDIFEQNGTAYTVGEYAEGTLLSTYIKQQGGRLKWGEARRLFLPLLSSISALHAAGVLHLAICPDNILIGTDGKLHLRGFAIPQARTVNTDLKPQLMTGYAAPEQYDLERECTAATDVYGLAATIFHTITGNPPPDGSVRDKSNRDLLLSAEVADEVPTYVAAALSNALQVQPENRTATVEELRNQLSAAPAVSAMLDDGQPAAPAPVEEKKKKSGNFKYPLVIGLGIAGLLLIIVGVILANLYPDMFSSEESDPGSGGTLPVATLPSTTDPNAAGGQTDTVPSLLKQNYYSISKTTSNGFKIELEAMVFSNTDARGTILSQTPNAGEAAEIGSTIRVIISIGPEKVDVPDLRGWKQEHATQFLEALGFKVDVILVQDSDYERGYVDSTSPEAGSGMEWGQTILLRVSDVAPSTEPPTEPSQEDPPTTTTHPTALPPDEEDF